MAFLVFLVLFFNWVWRRLVARYLGVVEAAGSNPVTQISVDWLVEPVYGFFICQKRAFDARLMLVAKILMLALPRFGKISLHRFLRNLRTFHFRQADQLNHLVHACRIRRREHMTVKS